MKKIYFSLLALFLSTGMYAQLFVDTTYSVQQMVDSFFNGQAGQITNLQYSGGPGSMAFFEGSASNIGLNAGILLTSGLAEKAIGPDDSESAGESMGLPGSIWLDAFIPGYVTYDASIIEMDIVPTSDTLSFTYVFGSEEYQEFVNSNFNDIFAFLVEGPGLPQGDSIYVAADTVVIYNQDSCYTCIDTFLVFADTFCYFDSLLMADTCIFYADTLYEWCYFDPNCPGAYDTIVYPGYWYYSPGGVNIAKIPGTNLPVTINTLNQYLNTQFFVDNQGGQSIQYDAFTVPLSATVAVQPGQTYHVRIAIADAGDHIFDSGVFLGIQSLGGKSYLNVVSDFTPQPESVGSKTIDFVNQSFWGTQYLWSFGDGSTSTEKNPTHTYLNDGTYSVSLQVSNWCSTQTYTQTLTLGASGLQELTAADVFALAPTPTTGPLTLLLKQGTEAQARLLNAQGRLLYEGLVTDGHVFDLKRYPAGTYLMQLTVDGKIWNSRVVKY